MNILFVTHDCSRTGAPIVLLNLIRWLVAEKKIKADILFKDTGELLKDFQDLTQRQYYFFNPAIHTPKFFRILFSFLGKWRIILYRKFLFERMMKNKYDLIYVNSAASSKILNSLKEILDIPCIFHIHELEGGIKYFNFNKEFELALRNSKKVIPVSNQVKTLLVDKFLVSEDKLKVVNEFIDEIEINPCNGKVWNQSGDKNREFIVGASGTINLRKGTDLFINIAAKLFYSLGDQFPIKFVWVGGNPRSLEYFYLQKDIENLELESKIIIVPEVENPFPYYNSFDVFLMTSREDPFPLVCLENARLGKPILYFEGATGISEFLDCSDFCNVEYLNIDQMGSKILRLYGDQELYSDISNFVKSESSKYRTEILADEIFKVIIEIV